MTDIFLSYAREDAKDAARLVEALKSEGWSVWWDDHIGIGTEFRTAISAELETARCVVVLWSKTSVAKQFVRDEASFGLKRGVLLPVRLDGTEPPIGFREIQTGSLETWEVGLRRLDAAIREKIGGVTRDDELRYLERLIEETRKAAQKYSALSGFESRRSKRTALGELFDDEPHIALLRHASRRRDMCEPERARDYEDILEAFGQVKRAALLGAPGSGKSTTLRKLAAQLAMAAREDPAAPLPVLVSLGEWTGDQPLARFIAERTPEIRRGIDGIRNRIVLLLDGLNEVPTTSRKAKAAEVRDLCGSKGSEAIVVSCRAEDYRDELDLGLDTLTLAPLSPWRIRSAVRQWVSIMGKPEEVADRFFWQLAGDERLAAVLEKWLAEGASWESFWDSGYTWEFDWSLKIGFREEELWRRHIPNPRSLMRLASNPYLLTMLYCVWAEEDEALPNNRGELFGRFINRLLAREHLLTREYNLTPNGEKLLAGLSELAWRVQRLGVLTVVPRSAALDALGSETLLKHAVDGTLLEGGTDIRFGHQLLQEYFAARALRSRLDQLRADELWPGDRWWQRTGWEGTVLLAGLYSTGCAPVIRWLANAQPEVAADCVLNSGAEIAERPALLDALQEAWMPRLTGPLREPEPEGRAAVGRALGMLSLDNRKGVGLRQDGLPDIDWVEIPAGVSLYRKRRRRSATFYIARYPVTNAQYDAFVHASDGYADDRWWRAVDGPDRTRRPARWSESNHPRETVSWHEAMAFCAWLSERLGHEIRLPTEWEWERAARGNDRRIYPWGNEYLTGRANINEIYGGVGPHYLARTSAVGIYFEGASPYDVMDLSGNVWEWCLNEADPVFTWIRGLRGGCWSHYQIAAVADHVHCAGQNDRDEFTGFRVVSSSPPR